MKNMEISRKTDYAIRMLSSMVRNPNQLLSVREAAVENDIPYSFARSIQHDLVIAGLVASTRGVRGGMSLAINPKQVSILDIVEAVQGPILISSCDWAGPNHEPCERKDACYFGPLWCSAEKTLRDFFASITLYQVVIEGLMPKMVGEFKLIRNKNAVRNEELIQHAQAAIESELTAGTFDKLLDGGVISAEKNAY